MPTRRSPLPHLIAAALLSLTGCGKPEYDPLREGIEWEYEVTGSPRGTFRYTRRIDGVRQIDGRSYLRSVVAYPDFTGEYFLRNTRDTLYFRPDEKSPETLAGIPLRLGARWTVHDPVLDEDDTTRDSTIYVVEGKERVVLPQATYSDCFRIRSESTRGARTVTHYCAGVGMVRNEVQGPTPTVYSLVRFSEGRQHSNPGAAPPAAAREDGQLSSTAAARALAAWARKQGGGGVQLIGVRELPAENRAVANIRLLSVPYRDPVFENHRVTQGSKVSRAEFTRYNERGWVLSRVVYGEFADLVWNTDVPVEPGL